MFKFLHSADFHLDSPLRGLAQYPGAPAEQIRQATRRALENLVDLAIREKVAFVLIAGDLYDRDRDDYNVVLFFNQQMKRLDAKGIRAFVIRGNHDAANQMATTLNPPPNVRVFPDDEPLSVELDQSKVMIHGQGFAREKVETDLSLTYPEGPEGYFNIGMLHTCAGGVDGYDRYAPCSYDVLRSKRYQYWALGHIHKHGPAFGNGDQTIQFSGTPQGRYFRDGELGPKGCLLVTVDDRHNLQTEFRPLDVLRWERCAVDARRAETPEEVLQRFACELRGLLSRADGRPLAVRVELRGECTAHPAIAADLRRWTNEIRSRATQESGERAWVEKVKLLTIAPHAGDDVQQLDGPIGELACLVAELQSDPDRQYVLSRELDDLTTRLAADLRPDERQDLLPDGPQAMASFLDEVQELLSARLAERRRP